MHILFIDTSTERGIIACGNQENLLFAKELPFGPSQSKFLMPYLIEALEPFGHPPPIDIVGVGVGPGSYTVSVRSFRGPRLSIQLESASYRYI